MRLFYGGLQQHHQMQGNVLSKALSSEPDLRSTMAEKVPAFREEVAAFRRSHGGKKVGEITVESLYGGMRMLGLVTETSVLDPEQGIRFRGLSIPEVQQVLPKADGGEQPLPEGLFWLLLTGEVPSRGQVQGLSEELATKADLPTHVVTLLANLPPNLHPMAQLVAAMAALNSESRFAASYRVGMRKTDYWKETLEDSINLIAKLPVVAATIHNNLWRDQVVPCPPDPKKRLEPELCPDARLRGAKVCRAASSFPHDPRRP